MERGPKVEPVFALGCLPILTVLAYFASYMDAVSNRSFESGAFGVLGCLFGLMFAASLVVTFAGRGRK